MGKILLIALIFCAGPVLAEMVVAARTIRANAIITEFDVTLAQGQFANGYERLHDVIGQESRVVLYTGRPIILDEIGPPAIIARNQIVSLSFRGHGLKIMTEGRALERGAVGDIVRIMNISSRATLFGQVSADGTVVVRE